VVTNTPFLDGAPATAPQQNFGPHSVPHYYPRQIDIGLEDGIIKAATFTGGCRGDTQGIAAPVKTPRGEEAAARAAGIGCRGKDTSCSARPGRALRSAL